VAQGPQAADAAQRDALLAQARQALASLAG